MANFEQALIQLLKNEGGYVNDTQDSGGETYKGIARKYNSKWEGWVDIDLAKMKPNFPQSLESSEALKNKVSDFYEVNYWDRVRGDDIVSQRVAFAIFDFGVNAGIYWSSKLAQLSVGATPDGVIGQKSLEALNSKHYAMFLATFAIAKIERYISLVQRDPKNRKFFYGWVRRALEGA